MKLEYQPLSNTWMATLPSGARIWSIEKEDVQEAIDAIEEVQTVQRENRGIILGCILAAFVLGLSAVAAAFFQR